MKKSHILSATLAAFIATGWLPHVTSTSQGWAAGTTAAAQDKQQTFDIANMTCELCPATVKKAMERVQGVKSVSIDFDAKTATVSFDASATTIEAIAAAATDIGYPATARN